MASFKIVPKGDSNNSHGELASKIMHMRTQFHIFHLQVEGIGSYAAHKALQGLYEGILDKGDTLIETIQGKIGSKIRGYKSYPYLEDGSFVQYTKDCISYFEGYRSQCPKPSWDNIDNQIQTIVDDLEQALYLFTLQ